MDDFGLSEAELRDAMNLERLYKLINGVKCDDCSKTPVTHCDTKKWIFLCQNCSKNSNNRRNLAEDRFEEADLDILESKYGKAQKSEKAKPSKAKTPEKEKPVKEKKKKKKREPSTSSDDSTPPARSRSHKNKPALDNFSPWDNDSFANFNDNKSMPGMMGQSNYPNYGMPGMNQNMNQNMPEQHNMMAPQNAMMPQNMQKNMNPNMYPMMQRGPMNQQGNMGQGNMGQGNMGHPNMNPNGVMGGFGQLGGLGPTGSLNNIPGVMNQKMNQQMMPGMGEVNQMMNRQVGQPNQMYAMQYQMANAGMVGSPSVEFQSMNQRPIHPRSVNKFDSIVPYTNPNVTLQAQQNLQSVIQQQAAQLELLSQQKILALQQQLAGTTRSSPGNPWAHEVNNARFNTYNYNYNDVLLSPNLYQTQAPMYDQFPYLSTPPLQRSASLSAVSNLGYNNNEAQNNDWWLS